MSATKKKKIKRKVSKPKKEDFFSLPFIGKPSVVRLSPKKAKG